MRKKIHHQLPMVYPLIDHEHAAELQHISAIVDRMPLAAELVLADLQRDIADISTGRPGLSGDQILRIIVLKQMNGFSYQELSFHLADSRCYRAFCGLGIDEKSPSKSTLQANIKKIRSETLEAINRLVLLAASDAGVEQGRQVRVDCTVVEANITYYGHKICLATGKSVLLLDGVLQEGNPADSSLAVDMALRQERPYSRPPRQITFDGGFASKENLKQIKSQGIREVAFSKKRGLQVLDMVKSTWVYKRLRRWRAGMEGIISFLKRCFGLGRCLWRGELSFRSYVWSSIVSANLLMLARHAME